MGNLFTISTQFLPLFLLLLYVTDGRARDDLSDKETDMEEPIEENYENCAPPYFGTGDIQPVPNSLQRMGPNSKYFVVSGENLPIKDVGPYCNRIGLQAAEIKDNIELLAIDHYMNVHAPPSITLSIGANDEVKEGSFVESDGITPLLFHSFAETQPNNRLNMESCIALSRHPIFHQFVYMDVTCDTEVTPMCMYRKESSCYFSSPLSTASSPSGFLRVGTLAFREYFVGLRQFPRSIAAAECEKEGYQLVDFDTGLENNQVLYEMLKKFLDKNGLFPRSAFWTGAKLVSKDTNGKISYQFLTSGRDLGDLSYWPSLAWDTDEPTDSSNQDLEECISAILYEEYSSSTLNTFTLATTNCRIPHYPICFKEKPKKTDESEREREYRNLEERSRNKIRGRSQPKTCEIVPTTDEGEGEKENEGGPIKLNITLTGDGLSNDDMIDLSTLSRKGILGSETQRIKLDEDKPWLTPFIEAIFSVAKKACPHDMIPGEYFNIMHNVLLLYYNSVLDKLVDPVGRDLQRISEATTLLQNCVTEVAPLEFETVGGMPVKYNNMVIAPIAEEVEERRLNFDLIIESFWHSFLTAVSSCYEKASSSRTYWLFNIHYTFVKYFMEVFEDQWLDDVGKILDWGIVVGDMDLNEVYYDVRVSAVASFVRNSIPELYFARPLYLKDKDGTINTINKKSMK